MAKIKKNFFLPRELVEWMSSQEHGGMTMTDIVTMGVEIVSKLDTHRLIRISRETGLPVGMIVDISPAILIGILPEINS